MKPRCWVNAWWSGWVAMAGAGGTLLAGGVVRECTEEAFRGAIEGGGEVTFACTGVIALSQPAVISVDTQIDAGGAAVTLSGGGGVRLFEVRPGATLRLTGLTLRDGRAEAGGAVWADAATLILDRCVLTGHQAAGSAGALDRPGGVARGGAIYGTHSVVHATGCRVEDNRATGGAGGGSGRQGARGGAAAGGAIWVTGGSLRLVDCQVRRNEALGGTGGRGIQGGHGGDAFGGAIGCETDEAEILRTAIDGGRARGGAGGMGTTQDGPAGGGSGGGFYCAAGVVRMTACTVARCEAGGSPANPAFGGGVANLATLLALNMTVALNRTAMTPSADSRGGGIYNEGFLTADHCTLAANAATGGVQDKGGNLDNAGGYVALRGSVIAYSTNHWDVFGGVIDQGGNLCWDATARFTDPTSRNLTDPKLGPLADNGGAVQTMVLLPGSPAADAVQGLALAAEDARGFPRPAGAGADAGAVEGVGWPPALSALFEPALVRTGLVTTLRVALTNPNPFALRQVVVRPTFPGGLIVASSPAAEAGCGGVVEANAGQGAATVTFPELGPGDGCWFRIPLVSWTPTNAVFTLATSSSANLGTVTGPAASAQVRSLAEALVTTLPAEFRGEGVARLRGTVLGLAPNAEAFFEYGTDTNYGSRTAAQLVSGGGQEVAVEAEVTGLAAATAYRFRLVVREFGVEVAARDLGFATPTPGAGTALCLDGADDWVDVERGFGEVTNTFTMEFWAWPTAGQALPPFGEGINGVYDGRPLRLAVYPTEGARRYGPGRVGVGVSVATNGVVVFEHGAALFYPVLIHAGVLTNWTHVAVVYGGYGPQLYLNGTKVRTGLPSGRVAHPSIELGSTHDTLAAGLGYYQGCLDEIRVWNRMLPEAELRLLSQAAAGGGEPGLVACLHLDEGTGWAVRDAAGGGYDGEAMNGPTWAPSTAPLGKAVFMGLAPLETTPEGAVLGALVAAGASAARLYFEWGVDGGAAHRTTGQDLPPSFVMVTANEALPGLRPGLTYTYRAVLEQGGTTQHDQWRTFRTPTDHPAGGALRLGGGEDAVRLGTPFQSVSNAFTMEFWIRPEAHRPETLESSIGGVRTDDQPYVFVPQYGVSAYGAGRAGAGVAVGTNGVSVFEHGAFHTPSVLVYSAPLTGWTHVAVVYRDGECSLYVDGLLVRQRPAGSRPVHPSADLARTTSVLGGEAIPGGGTGRGVGTLDEVRVWSVARTAEQIREAMYHPLAGTEFGLVLYYDFEGGPSGEAADRSAFGRRGVLYGNPQWVESEATLNMPRVARAWVEDVHLDRATLAAEIDPLGHPTTAVVEWGLTPSFGQMSAPQSVGAGSERVRLGAELSGLTAGTLYYYRVALEMEGRFAVGELRSFTTPRPGGGTALVFDGTNAWVHAGPAFPDVRDTFTMELWVKPAATIDLVREERVSDSWPAQQRLALYPNLSTGAYGDGHATVGISVGRNGVNVVEHAHAHAPVLLSYQAELTNWTHVAVVFVQGTPSLLLDGQPVRTGLTSTKTVHPGSCLSSETGAVSTGLYAGWLDDVRIWNVARSAEHIAADRRRVLAGTEPHLVRLWRLDESGSGQARNSAAGSDTGTIVGAVHVASDGPLGQAYIEHLRVVRSSPQGTDFECVVDGNGAGGVLRIVFGADDHYDRSLEPVAVEPGDRNRVLAFRIGGDGLGPNLFYRAALEGEGGWSSQTGSRLAIVTPTQGAALEFDGSRGAVTMPNEPFVGVLRNFTMEFWCRPEGERQTSGQFIRTFMFLGTQRFVIYPSYGPALYGVNATAAGVSVGTNGVTVVEHGAGIWSSTLVHDRPLAGWHHVAVAFSNGLPRLYLDGEFAHQGFGSALPVGPGVGLGGGPPTAQTLPYFKGQVDEVRIWRRSLTAREIQAALYRPLRPPVADLVWCQHLNEGWGGWTADAVDPTRGGTLNAGVAWVASEAPVMELAPCTLLPDGGVRLQFAAAPTQTFVLDRSSDLHEWWPIRTNASSSRGVFEHVDRIPPPPSGAWFFRLRP